MKVRFSVPTLLLAAVTASPVMPQNPDDCFSRGEGMGLEFTYMGPRDRVLLGQLLRRLLQ